MSIDKLKKSETWKRIISSWISTVLGFGLLIAMVLCVVFDKVEVSTASGWGALGLKLIGSKDSLLSNDKNF